MNVEAEIAKQVSYQFEAKKDALKQVQDGSVKVTFTIHPQDMPLSLYGDPMGQRFMCVLVALNDDETPRSPPSSSDKGVAATTGATTQAPVAKRKWEELSYAERAGIRCTQIEFQEYSALKLNSIEKEVWGVSDGHVAGPEPARKYVCHFCNVESRSNIKAGTDAAHNFEKLEQAFDTWLKYERNR